MDLNDDCLLAILDFLSIGNLVNIGKICQRLQAMTVLCFQSHHHSTLKLDAGKMKQRVGFEQVLKVFGPAATKITFSINDVNMHQHHDELGTQVFVMIAKYCKNIVGMELLFVCVDLTYETDETMLSIQQLMSNVIELSFISSSLPEPIFRFCRALETLTLRCVTVLHDGENNNRLNQHFPNLKTLSIHEMPNSVINGLLAANQNNIQSLKLDIECYTRKHIINPYHIIAEARQLPHLTDLFISLNICKTSEDYVNHLISEVAKMPALRVLKLELISGIATVTKDLFRSMSAVSVLQEIHLRRWSPENKEMISIKLRRSDVIHELYQSFAPF